LKYRPLSALSAGSVFGVAVLRESPLADTIEVARIGVPAGAGNSRRRGT